MAPPAAGAGRRRRRRQQAAQPQPQWRPRPQRQQGAVTVAVRGRARRKRRRRLRRRRWRRRRALSTRSMFTARGRSRSCVQGTSAPTPARNGVGAQRRGQGNTQVECEHAILLAPHSGSAGGNLSRARAAPLAARVCAPKRRTRDRGGAAAPGGRWQRRSSGGRSMCPTHTPLRHPPAAGRGRCCWRPVSAGAAWALGTRHLLVPPSRSSGAPGAELTSW